jgi:signal transduction histidine kinase
MPTSPAAGRATPLTIAALAEQLGDGPLQCLTALQVKTSALAENAAKSEQEYLEELEDLVRLAQCAMSRFHEFTNSLRTVVEQVASQSADSH